MGANQNNKSRRSFIKKAAVGAAITSLPVKSVWATTNCSLSGQLSGNLSQNVGDNLNQTCDVPILMGGRSPGFWYDGNQLTMNSNGNAIKDVFPQMGTNPSMAKKNCYRTMVINVRDTNKLGINSTLANEMNVSTNITLTQAFAYTGINKYKAVLRHGAAAYLNTYFELYNGVFSSMSAAQSRMAAEEVANMVMNKIFIDKDWPTDSNMGYNNGYSTASSASFLFGSIPACLSGTP